MIWIYKGISCKRLHASLVNMYIAAVCAAKYVCQMLVFLEFVSCMCSG